MLEIVRPATRLDVNTLVLVDQGKPMEQPVLRVLRCVVPPDPHGFVYVVTNPDTNEIGKFRRAFVVRRIARPLDVVLTDIANILDRNPNTKELGSLVREAVATLQGSRIL